MDDPSDAELDPIADDGFVGTFEGRGEGADVLDGHADELQIDTGRRSEDPVDLFDELGKADLCRRSRRS